MDVFFSLQKLSFKYNGKKKHLNIIKTTFCKLFRCFRISGLNCTNENIH